MVLLTTRPFSLHTSHHRILLILITGYPTLSSSADNKNQHFENCGRTGGGKTFVKDGVSQLMREFPWMVQLRIKGSYLCGATIMSRIALLTAAHCIRSDSFGGVEPRNVVGYVGRLYTNSGGEQVSVRRIIVHPDFNLEKLTSDIAVLVLSSPIKYGPNVGPVCVDNDKLRPGKKVTAMGWGYIDKQKNESSVLMKVELDTISNSECQSIYEKSDSEIDVTHKVICTLTPGKDACQGDSGGPLVVFKDGKYFQKGIASWGIKCADNEHPGVWTDVTPYKRWLDDQLRGAYTQKETDPVLSVSSSYARCTVALQIMSTILIKLYY